MSDAKARAEIRNAAAIKKREFASLAKRLGEMSGEDEIPKDVVEAANVVIRYLVTEWEKLSIVYKENPETRSYSELIRDLNHPED